MHSFRSFLPALLVALAAGCGGEEELDFIDPADVPEAPALDTGRDRPSEPPVRLNPQSLDTGSRASDGF